MAGVDEKDIATRRGSLAFGGSLSEQAIAKQEVALAYLQSHGYSYDYASELLRQKGADTVLAEKAKAEAPAPAPAKAPAPEVAPETPSES